MAGLTDVIAQELFGELHSLAKSLEATADRIESLDSSVAANVESVVSNATDKLHTQLKPLSEVVNQIATVVGKAALMNTASDKTAATAAKIETMVSQTTSQLAQFHTALSAMNSQSMSDDLNAARIKLQRAALQFERAEQSHGRARAFSSLLLASACLALGVLGGIFLSPSHSFMQINDIEAMRTCSVPGFMPMDTGLDKNIKYCTYLVGTGNSTQRIVGWKVSTADLK
ncbi:MAG: hypothetical protein ACXWJZ_03665 [Burkholderiaceae bacterium]